MKDLLVSVTGLRGSGKSTQIMRLADAFHSQGIDTHSIALYWSEVKISQVLAETKKYLKRHNVKTRDKEEQLMIMQAMGLKLSWNRYVRPLLGKGRIFLFDRYTETYDIDFREYEVPHAILETIPKCDINFILQVDVGESIRRLEKRGGKRYQNLKEIQEKRERYQDEVLSKDPRYTAIDSNQDADLVFHKMKERIYESWVRKNENTSL